MGFPSPIFIGFRVKQVHKTAGNEWDRDFLPANVVEICSMSDCRAQTPPNWDGCWRFNSAGCFNTEEIALAAVPPDQSDLYELFACRFFPLEFCKGAEARQMDLPSDFLSGLSESASMAALAAYQSIGYDVAASPLEYMGFGCSPLSCNGCAADFPVNRHCLIEDLALAVEVARNFAETEPEPGPYYLYEVLRKRSPRWMT